MKSTYEVIEENDTVTIKRTDADGKEFWIPAVAENSDYQRYLRWLENPDAEENGTISQEYGETLQSWSTTSGAT